jgi:hypothetical protein
VAEEAGDKQQIGARMHFQVTLNGGLCRKCNNERLGGPEQTVQPILEPIAVPGQPTNLDLASQRLLAVWAIKTAYLLELEWHPARMVKPPPRSMVLLACWDCKIHGSVNHASMVHYAPSSALLPTPDGGEVVGQFTRLAIGFAAFQVLDVDYEEAEVRKAVVETGPPDSIAKASRLIWPHRKRRDINSPPAAFPHDSVGHLANRDLALRRGVA